MTVIKKFLYNGHFGTTIMTDNYDQNDRYNFHNDRYMTKMTVMDQNDRYLGPK